MTPEIRTKLLLGRVTHYNTVMLTTIFALVAVAAIIELGPGGYSAPLTMLVVASTAYGVLAGGSALEDMINLREDMGKEMAETAYGKGVAARNLPALRMTSAVLLSLVGIAELYAIFT